MDEAKLLKPLRYVCAACIAAGGLMHAIALAGAVAGERELPWWAWGIFTTAVFIYAASAATILLNRFIGYLIAAGGPIVGGTLIVLGLLSEELTFEILIPGMITNEITLIGFFTLATEPVAVVLSIFLMYRRIWRYR